MSRTLFITATDTNAGKTWVTSSLLRTCLAQGLDIQALKPIASGLNDEGVNEDVAILLADQPNRQQQDINFITYDRPLAPALAAQQQGCTMQIAALHNWTNQQIAKYDITLIEGVGGMMVPLLVNDKVQWLVSDWLKSLVQVEVMLVVPLRLGCMNQALLNCQYLQSIGQSPRWLVFNDMDNTDTFEETTNVLKPVLHNMLHNMPEILCLAQGGAMPQLV
ncbi:MAG: dethiobiotin synthase [Ghiorsea sp.]|nr:dethiobiotin synthase [Ghiorsea sp.]